jgi:nifR3 family TIM-barrel protein
MKGFWKTLSRPAIVLAPMADVTDPAFRRIIARYGKPDVMWTEFVSADGLAFAPEEGRAKLLADLQFSEAERPIVAQFFTSRPETMEQAARLACELGFDGIDINMGCPDSSIEKQGAGAAMMKDAGRAKEVIAAAKQGAETLPVSVKTRIGFNTVEIDTWLPAILATGLAVVTVHARTRKEMSKVPARWEFVQRAVQLRDEHAPETLILGNGDVLTLDAARQKVAETGCDGVMIGKGIFGNPWLWSGRVPDLRTRLGVLIEHVRLFEELLPHKSFHIMKKHFKAYVHGFDGASELRGKLMEADHGDDVERIVNDYLNLL